MKFPEVLKMVNSAWRSKQPIAEWFDKGDCNMRNQGYTTFHYRQLGDIVFVFQVDDKTIPTLITVYTR